MQFFPWSTNAASGDGQQLAFKVFEKIADPEVFRQVAHDGPRAIIGGTVNTFATDLPVHACTTIGREYAIAAALGFSPAELLAVTRNSVRASFTSTERRAALLDELCGWEATLPTS